MTAHIYVHIPFCKSRCIYCDFFSTTDVGLISRYVDSVCHEARERRNELQGQRVTTIYIGGGTPSLLQSQDVVQLMDCLRSCYDVDNNAEVTIEMNPDDVEAQHHSSLIANLPSYFNRVSLGIQTFDDGLLRMLHRRHDANTAINAVNTLHKHGINNISIDLIYGLPGQTMQIWEHDMDTAFGLGMQHLSAYALSYEPGTALSRLRDDGTITPVADESMAEMYDKLCERAEAEGFCHYEISNWARPNYASRHNSSYWYGHPYIGLGPGAHSYDGQRTRRANKPSLHDYMQRSNTTNDWFVLEHLTDIDAYNEAAMCGLRTASGIDIEAISATFGCERVDYLLHAADTHVRAGNLLLVNGHLRLSRNAIMISDSIMADLMAIE